MSDTEFAAQAALYAALAEAVADCSAVIKRGQGQGYLYAEAEAVVAEADRVMAPRGLVVIPGPATVINGGDFETKNGKRTLFYLRREFTLVHKDGGRHDGGAFCIALGTNLGATPPQATTSAGTTALAYFLKDLLRMPRSKEEDVEHSSNNRGEQRRDEEPRPAAAPQQRVPVARKATMVLKAIGAASTLRAYENAADKWAAVLSVRGQPDPETGEPMDEGYTDAEVAEIKAALAAAKERVKV